MSWTYDPSMATEVDKVRFLIQDTVITRPLLQNEEIQFMLTQYPDYRMAAANCADVISAQYATKADGKTIGNLELSYRNIFLKYADLAKRLRMQASKFVLPYAGGISTADKQTQEQDPDRVKPSFKRGQMNEKLPDLDFDGDD